MNARRPAEGLEPLTKQSLQLRSVQAVAADDATIQEQHRDIQSVSALQNGVTVDIDDLDRGQRGGATERFQLAQHLVAQLTVVAVNDLQARRLAQW